MTELYDNILESSFQHIEGPLFTEKIRSGDRIVT